MCTSIVYNGKNSLVGLNLDILDMQYRVSACNKHVWIEIWNEKEGWLPLFGVNAFGDFVHMPTCWPFDARSNPSYPEQENILQMDIDLLIGKKNFAQTKELAEQHKICSMPGITYQAQIADHNGNVLQVVPGQGTEYLERPKHAIMTNFSLYKGSQEKHPWMGMDRYLKAEAMIQDAGEELDAFGMMAILKEVSQTVCPTVVSMVYDHASNMVTWCEGRAYDSLSSQKIILSE
jgi:hypothetical protein